MCRAMVCLIALSCLILLSGCAEEDTISPRPPVPVPVPVPVVTILLDESVKVAPGTYRAWDFDLLIGAELHGEIESKSDVNVWLLSPREYTAFQSGDTFYYEKVASRKRTLGFKFTYTVEASGKYYLVLDNKFSWISSKAVSVYVESVR